MPLRSCLYRGRVVHCRLRPVRHSFRYRVFSLYLDLDETVAVGRQTRLFSIERPNLFSFHARDHGPRNGSPLKPWVLAQLAPLGIKLRQPRIMLLCFPRVLGYVFNPLSIYVCYDDDLLKAVLYEVKNTFGEQHVYTFAVSLSASGRIPTHRCSKAFYVSPFLDMDGRYEFELTEPDERFTLVIRQMSGGEPLLLASQIGRRFPLADHTLVHCLATDLLMTWKVMVGIHLEALRLWCKGVPVFRRRTGTLSAR